MRRALLLVATLAACDDSIAIEIRVPADFGAQEVELFVALDACKLDGVACDGIGPEGMASRIAGDVYDRDGNQSFRAPVRDGVAEFRFAADAVKIPTIIAIGQPADPTSEDILGATQLFDIDLAGGATRYIATLESVETSSDREAKLWRRSDGVGCAGFRRRGATLTTFVVAKGDPDCDEIEESLECDPLVYKAQVAASGTTCVTHADAGGEQVCMFGTPACVDGEGPSGCTPAAACIPERLCQCEGDQEPGACLLGALLLPELTRIDCTFPLYQENPDGDFVPCDAKLEAKLSPMLFQRACGRPELLLDATTQLWGQQLPVVIDATHTLTVNVDPTPVTTCSVKIHATGLAPPAGALTIPRTLMRLPVPGANRTVLVPIDFRFERVGDVAACPAGPLVCSLTFGPADTTETLGACGR